jgi:2-keto-4-pentenoate hydratase
MNTQALASLGFALRQARDTAVPLASLAPGWAPPDLGQAWRAQHAIWGGEPIAGWKVSAVMENQRQAMGVAQPVSSPLLAAWTRESGGGFAAEAFIAPLLECEIAFELGADLPWREHPYTRAEVDAAILAVRPVIEIVDSRLPAGSDTLVQIVDDFNNGGFVVGAAVSGWRALDLANCAITLHVTRRGERVEAARGSGRAVLDGDLLAAVVAMANSQCPLYEGLRAGQIVTTGTCTGAVPLAGATLAEAHFDPLGPVRVRFDAASAPHRRIA